MLPTSMFLSTTIDRLEFADRVHSIFTLWLPHYMVLTSNGIFPRFMLATSVIFNNDFGYNIILSQLCLWAGSFTCVQTTKYLLSRCQRKSLTDCDSYNPTPRI